jgi:selenocysteine-specific elongation factor
VHILPDGLSSRARQLQSHNVKLTRISAGMRGALNLVNISVPQLSRGDTLVRPGTAEATRLLDAKVQLLPSAPRTLSRTSAVKLYAAASQRTARMTLTDQAKLNPGEESYVRLRLSHPLCIFPGDRFVLRGGSPEFTIAGGAVLDIAPVKVKKQDKTSWLSLLEKASREQTALAFLSQAQTGAKLREIAKRMGEPVSSVRALFDEHERNMRVLFTDVSDDVLLIAREQFDGLKIKLLDEVRTFFKSQPHRLYMSREELRSRLGPSLALQLFEKVLTGLTEAGEIQESREGVSLAKRTAQITKAQKAAKEHIEKMFVDAGISPPTFSQAEESLPDSSHAKQMLSLLIEEKVSPLHTTMLPSMGRSTPSEGILKKPTNLPLGI